MLPPPPAISLARTEPINLRRELVSLFLPQPAMSMLKRKSPYGSMSPAPGMGSRGASVKSEGGSDLKRMKGAF